MNKLILLTLLLLAACSGDPRDHWSTGTVTKVYTKTDGEGLHYELDFVPDMSRTDTITFEIDTGYYTKVNVGDRIDYQKIKNQ